MGRCGQEDFHRSVEHICRAIPTSPVLAHWMYCWGVCSLRALGVGPHLRRYTPVCSAQVHHERINTSHHPLTRAPVVRRRLCLQCRRCTAWA